MTKKKKYAEVAPGLGWPPEYIIYLDGSWEIGQEYLEKMAKGNKNAILKFEILAKKEIDLYTQDFDFFDNPERDAFFYWTSDYPEAYKTLVKITGGRPPFDAVWPKNEKKDDGLSGKPIWTVKTFVDKPWEVNRDTVVVDERTGRWLAFDMQ